MNQTVKKALNIAKTVLVWTVFAVAIFMMVFTIVSSSVLGRNDKSLFGYRMYIVNSDSMSATDFSAGDLIFVKEVDPTTLVDGDIITYISQNTESFGEIITHKIRTKTVDASGSNGFITYGTTTDKDDEVVVTYPFIMGKYTSRIAKAGYFFDFLKTPQGYIVCIFVPFMLLIVYQGMNFFTLFRRYKKEQNEQIEEEKRQLEAEREENRRMLEELQALKAELNVGKDEEKI